jgi:glycosyltransferase involved in cell wall biosynthesis
LVEAVLMVLGYFPKAKFVIAGAGPEKDGVIARAHELGVAHAVRFLGAVPRGDYIDLIRARLNQC